MAISPLDPAISCCFCDKSLSPGDNHEKTKSFVTKYKCPGCQRIYCSADCCSGHKEKFSCSGIRNTIPYVHLSKFDQKQFLDDYFFLEKVGDKIENAHRLSTRLRINRGNQREVKEGKHINKRRFNRRRNKKTKGNQVTTPNADIITNSDQK